MQATAGQDSLTAANSVSKHVNHDASAADAAGIDSQVAVTSIGVGGK